MVMTTKLWLIIGAVLVSVVGGYALLSPKTGAAIPVAVVPVEVRPNTADQDAEYRRLRTVPKPTNKPNQSY